MIFDEWDFHNYVEIFDNYTKNRFMIDCTKIEQNIYLLTNVDSKLNARN